MLRILVLTLLLPLSACGLMAQKDEGSPPGDRAGIETPHAGGRFPPMVS